MKACPYWCWKETSPAWLTLALGSACSSGERRFLPRGEGWGGQHRVWERNTHLISGMQYLCLQRNCTVGFKIKMSFLSNSAVITSDHPGGFLCLSAAKCVLRSEQGNAVQVWMCGGDWLVPALLSLTFHAANDGSWWRCLAVPSRSEHALGCAAGSVQSSNCQTLLLLPGHCSAATAQKCRREQIPFPPG